MLAGLRLDLISTVNGLGTTALAGRWFWGRAHNPRCRFDAGPALVVSDVSPGFGQVGRSIDLVDQRMDFPLSWILRSPSVCGRRAGLLDGGAGSFALRTCPHFRHVLTARRASTLPHSTGPSPSGRPFGSDRRRRLSGGDPGPFALTPFLSTSPRSDSWHRFGRNFACAYIRPYHRGLQAGLCVACFSPFRLRVSHDSSHTFPMDDTRPPWVTDALPHRVARTHLGATGWNPCAFAPRVRARPFPVFGRPVHRSGSLPLITTRWFSSSLSDPASRRAPCPPEHRRWWLQVGLSVSRLSPSCLPSLSIPSIHSGR